MKPVVSDLYAYIADNYGRCRVDDCLCRSRRWWLGRSCPNWEPAKAKTWEELRDEQQKG